MEKLIFRLKIITYTIVIFAILVTGCTLSLSPNQSPTPTLLIEKNISPTLVFPGSKNELILLLQDSNPEARIGAANRLGAMGSDAADAIPSLIINLYYDGVYDVRLAAVKALGDIGSKSKTATPTIVVVLLTDSVHVRIASAIALGKIGDESSIYGLIKALDDPDIDVAGEAARSIGIITNQNFPDIYSSGFQLDAQGIPIIVNSAKEWWLTEGQYTSWFDN